MAARKPAQSFDVDRDGDGLGGPTDAEVLGAATGEHPGEVCHSVRSYHRAMAPPMAAEALGPARRSPWPTWWGSWTGRGPASDVGLVETAGGVRSPQADDGDVVDLVAALGPDLWCWWPTPASGPSTASGCRSTRSPDRDGPGDVPIVVVLNRYDATTRSIGGTSAWLADREGYRVVTLPGGDGVLYDLMTGTAG